MVFKLALRIVGVECYVTLCHFDPDAHYVGRYGAVARDREFVEFACKLLIIKSLFNCVWAFLNRDMLERVMQAIQYEY